MQFSSLEEMVDALRSEGVDIRNPYSIDLEFGWIESPLQLFEKHRAGEIRLEPHPFSGKLAMLSTRARVLMRTSSLVLLELYRIYPGGYKVEQFPNDQACVADFMRKSGWSLSETGKLYEAASEIAVRGILQELGLHIQVSELIPMGDPLLDDHASTIYPLRSLVRSYWFEWVLQQMPNLEFGLMRNDEDVQIFRALRPW